MAQRLAQPGHFELDVQVSLLDFAFDNPLFLATHLLPLTTPKDHWNILFSPDRSQISCFRGHRSLHSVEVAACEWETRQAVVTSVYSSSLLSILRIPVAEESISIRQEISWLTQHTDGYTCSSSTLFGFGFPYGFSTKAMELLHLL